MRRKVVRSGVAILLTALAGTGACRPAPPAKRLIAVITTYSQKQLGLKPGSLIAAEIKAPWVVLYKGGEAPKCTAENRFLGSVLRISKGKINSEVVVQISDSTELCSVLTEKSRKALQIKEGDTVWAVFNAASVVINVD